MSEAHNGHSDSRYIKIYGVLMVLFIISVLGPELGMPIVTLITAFGIALVKALMVAAWFMHLNTEKKYIWFLIISSLLFIVALFVGLAPDIWMWEGQNWRHCTPGTCVELIVPETRGILGL